MEQTKCIQNSGCKIKLSFGATRSRWEETEDKLIARVRDGYNWLRIRD
jgi:hypothetical protein